MIDMARGMEVAAECRLEIYHTDPRDEPDMTKWETQLTFRIADDSDM